MQKYGSSFEVILQIILYIPKLMVNLFSLTKAISTKGGQLSNKGQIITLQIGKNKIFFDTIFQHGSVQFLDIELHPIPNHIAATAHPLDINKLHTMFGHPNSQVLAATVSKYGFKTKNTLEHTCHNCAICKAKQKNLNKLGGRINIDISSLQTTSYGGPIGGYSYKMTSLATYGEISSRPRVTYQTQCLTGYNL
jgi:hypothetical protein